ncbi:hypothetical protein SAY86_018671 [Trapa natans]|uniref:Late embryogenesis abundant protein LEA-2 subgroup domain-containing protein n=1 Tax=Trapa natans TaxID=22666 RepID=A0AAN7LAP3_TRANT|nr:hypothetical protein SAY86_018671 [Trapa natans]
MSLYRPGRRHRRGCCCCRLCIWTTIAVFILLLLVAAAAALFYVVYRPHRPSFSVTSFRLGYLSIAPSGVKSKFSLTVTTWNPNKKLVYVYSPIDVTVLASDITIGKGDIPAFIHGKRNSTVLKSSATNSSQPLGSETLTKLKAAIKAKTGVSLKLRLDSKAKVKAGSFKTPMIGVRVICDGIRAVIPASGKARPVVSIADAICEVKKMIKIWKRTFLF